MLASREVTASMEGDGDGWKYGLCCICLGIVFVLSMGVFSMLYYGARMGNISQDKLCFFQEIFCRLCVF